MNTKEEEMMLQKMQGKFSNFIRIFSDELTKPELRFLKESCYGVLSSQSCIVRRTAQALRESIRAKKTQERLIYHLDKPDLNDKISGKLLEYQSRQMRDDSLILVDPSDIVKTYAEKMEGLGKVKDGNDGKWKTGYNALDIIGVHREGEEISLSTIYSDLCSETVELDTLKNKIFDRIVDIVVHSNNKGTFVFDRQFDDRKLIKHLHEHDASYIIRMKKNRDLIFNDEKYNIKKLADSIRLRYRFRVDKRVHISASIIPVGLRVTPHTKKNPDIINTNLIVAKITRTKKNGTKQCGMFYLLSNISRYRDERELVKYVLESYKLRWKIEEIHRQVKTDFGWENIQLLTFRRLRTMNTILWAAISFLYTMDKMKYSITKVFPFYMIEKSLSELNRFIYYKLALVIKLCFNMIRLYRKTIFYGNRSEALQLRLPGL